MKKILVGVLMIVLVFLSSISIAHAALGFFFGGRIINTEAVLVTVYEAAGYDCLIPGETIEVFSIMGPTSYFIPSGVVPVTGHQLSAGQQILGIYSGQTTITCTRDEEDKGGLFGGSDMVTSQVSFILDNITYFGTSAQ